MKSRYIGKHNQTGILYKYPNRSEWFEILSLYYLQRMIQVTKINLPLSVQSGLALSCNYNVPLARRWILKENLEKLELTYLFLT